jgi:DNA-binding transcriptional LysR family regulator
MNKEYDDALLNYKEALSEKPGDQYASDKIEENVLNDICEVGFITRNSNKEDLESKNVIEEKVVLISPKNYEIPEKIFLEEILNHPLIILQEECIIKDNLDMSLNDLGYNLDDLNILAQLESTEAIKTLVQKGYGLGFVPYNAVKEEYFDERLQISRIKDYNLDYNIYMVNKPSKKLTSETREFIKEFRNIKTHICG